MIGADVPEACRQSAATMLQERPRVILVLGGTDVGKSSYGRILPRERVPASKARVACTRSYFFQV